MPKLYEKLTYLSENVCIIIQYLTIITPFRARNEPNFIRISLFPSCKNNDFDDYYGSFAIFSVNKYKVNTFSKLYKIRILLLIDKAPRIFAILVQ